MTKSTFKRFFFLLLSITILSCQDEEIQKSPEVITSPKESTSSRKQTDTIVTTAPDTAIVAEDPSEEQKENAVIPDDKGGTHTSYVLNPDVNVYGHYVYLPGGYKESTADYPLIIFLHGMGERGNSKTDKTALPKVLRTGLSGLIEKGKWNPEHPAIVVTPQCHDGSWHPDKVHKFIEYIVSHYRIDKSRIYMTGLSMGGFGTFEYIGAYGNASYIAAAVPIAGGGRKSQGSSFVEIPIWAFHGEIDHTVVVTKSKDMIAAINAAHPEYQAKLTIFPNVGHVSWNMTYDRSGMGKESKKYDAFNEDVFSWMYKFSKNTTTNKIVKN